MLTCMDALMPQAQERSNKTTPILNKKAPAHCAEALLFKSGDVLLSHG